MTSRSCWDRTVPAPLRAARALGLGDAVTQIALSADAAHARSVRDAIAARPDVAHVQDTSAVRAQMQDLMGLGWVMLGAMLLFGAILAAAILFNTATLGVLERRRDLATLRALGRTQRELGLALTIEHLSIAAIGIAIGLPLAMMATRRLASAFSSDLFTLPYVISPATLAVAIGGIVGVLRVAPVAGAPQRRAHVARRRRAYARRLNFIRRLRVPCCKT